MCVCACAYVYKHGSVDPYVTVYTQVGARMTILISRYMNTR